MKKEQNQKFKCPECGCRLTKVSNKYRCTNPDCSRIKLEREEVHA